MNRDQVIEWLAKRAIDSDLIPDCQAAILIVDPVRQTIELLTENEADSRRYPVSTALNGLGNRQDSFQTPVGAHRIAEKVGEGEPSGMVFRGRRPTGELATDMDNQGADQITSRILWLEGLEPGVNRGGDCDSFERYIYIHGTSDEQRIGKPVSAGCIRMLNKDVIELFDKVEKNSPVLILDRP